MSRLDECLDRIDQALTENRPVQISAMTNLPPEMPTTPRDLLAYAKERRR